jgi:hypothetical protein
MVGAANRYERRDQRQVRSCQPLSAEILARAKQIIYADLGKRGAATRQAQRNGNGHA